jgi:hypothetical protein
MAFARIAIVLSVACLACAEPTAVAVPSGIAMHYGLQDSDVLEALDIDGTGGVVKLVLRRGDGAIPGKGQTVNAHYDGKLTDGKQFDSSRKRGQPFSFPLGQGRVIKGWDVGFSSMAVGKRRIMSL